MLGLLWLTTRRRSYALPQPEENAHVAAVRCRGPLVQPVGHLEQNAMRNMEMLFGTESAVTPGQKSWVTSAELRSKVLRLGTKHQGPFPNMRICFSAATLIPLHRLT